jgi:uncharacterized protein YfiM (DUF2279 family)
MDSLLVCLITMCAINNQVSPPSSISSSISISNPLMISSPLRIAAPAPTSYVSHTQDRWFGEDKLKHFALSYMITVGGYAGARFVAGHDESVLIGAGVGLAAGVAKELYDRKTNRSASLRDLLWDVAGVATGMIIAAQTR